MGDMLIKNIAMLDIWMKYGDVIQSDDVKEYFYSLKKEEN